MSLTMLIAVILIELCKSKGRAEVQLHDLSPLQLSLPIFATPDEECISQQKNGSLETSSAV